MTTIPSSPVIENPRQSTSGFRLNMARLGFPMNANDYATTENSTRQKTTDDVQALGWLNVVEEESAAGLFIPIVYVTALARPVEIGTGTTEDVRVLSVNGHQKLLGCIVQPAGASDPIRAVAIY